MQVGTLDKNAFKQYDLKYGKPSKVKEVKFLYEGKNYTMYIGYYKL